MDLRLELGQNLQQFLKWYYCTDNNTTVIKNPKHTYNILYYVSVAKRSHRH